MKQAAMTVAFAMGGLAGNNAHGAGFLQAALDRGVDPLMISCTSGQILWVSRYLKVASGQAEMDLKGMLREDVRAVNPTGNVNVALANLAVFGKPGVFVPARVEYLCDLMENASDTWRHLWTSAPNLPLAQEWLELFPCRYLVPDFPPAFFQEIAEVFRSSAIGIAFNSYNPSTGEEHVYLNDRARELLHARSRGRGHKYDPGCRSDYRDRTTYQDIDAAAVRDGLWLYQYGFDSRENRFVDGAYFRGLILSELAVAGRIFCVRPINHRWQGDLPRNVPGLEDLKTEIGFDGSYCGERYQIQLVNKLLGAKAVDADRYHPIDLQEIEIRQPRGFFDYLFESEQVFDDAHLAALQRFDELGMPERAR